MSNLQTLRLGTRRSALAMTQSGHVAEWVRAANPGRAVELVPVVTTGDRTQDRPFGDVGSVGMFVKELEKALLDGRIDFAVHSLKDVPTGESPGLVLAAIPERERSADALVSSSGAGFAALPTGARVGTSSPRRRAQIAAARPDLEMLELRGNIDTRLAKLDAGEYDAIILAAAGMHRLGLAGRITELFAPEVMLPAVGQGLLALQCRADDAGTRAALSKIDAPHAHAWALAERAFLWALGGGCHAPIAALADGRGDGVTLAGLVAAPDGGRLLRDTITGSAAGPEALGHELARRLLARGAADLLAQAGSEPAPGFAPPRP